MEVVGMFTTTKHKYIGKNPCIGIVVHNTANTNKGADALAHGRLQKNGNVRQASWHETVDDKRAVLSLKNSIRAWHAGNAYYNKNFYGIEICENSDGNLSKAIDNGARRVAAKLKELGLKPSRKTVIQHYDASKKDCPRRIRQRKNGWEDFLKAVQTYYNTDTKPVSKPKPAPKPPVNPPKIVKSDTDLAYEVIAGKHGNGAQRKKSLGARYKKVQAEVNRILKGAKKTKTPPKSLKSISKMADEVIRGQHGNGHDQRRKSLKVDASTYAKVRAEVNRRLLS